MKIVKKLSPIMESISNVGKNKKKELKEELDVNHPIGVLPHADAVATEQHIADRAAGLERRANPDKDPLVKELIDETASAKSRTLHYDVVDRKGLAKILTEAKKNKQKFKVGKSDKLGYRYFVDILPIYGSKGALEVDDESIEVDGEDGSETLTEDTKKLPNGKFANVGKDKKVDSGTFETKKEADDQRKAMFANGFKESLDEDLEKELKDYIKWCKENGREPKDGASLDAYFAKDKKLDEAKYKTPMNDSDDYVNAMYKAYKELKNRKTGYAAVYGYKKDNKFNKFIPLLSVKDSQDELSKVVDSLKTKEKGKTDVSVYTLFKNKLDDAEELLKEKGLLKENLSVTNLLDEDWDEDLETFVDDDLDEDLQVYTSTLKDFKPAKEAEELWNEIIEKGKMDDLEYALENVFKSDEDKNASIDIEGLNDLLVNHEDFIRTLIGLDDAPLEDKDYDSEDVEPVDNDDLIVDDEDEEEPVDADAPIDDEDDEDVIDYKTDKIEADDEEDIEPLTDAELANEDAEEYPEAPKYVDEEPKEEKKPSKWTKREDKVEEALSDKDEKQKKINALRAKLKEDCECDHPCDKEPELKLDDEDDDLEECNKPIKECDTSKDDELTENIANAYVKSRVTEAKPTDKQAEYDSLVKKTLPLLESDEEVVDISDDDINQMTGAPTEADVKKECKECDEKKPVEDKKPLEEACEEKKEEIKEEVKPTEEDKKVEECKEQPIKEECKDEKTK